MKPRILSAECGGALLTNYNYSFSRKYWSVFHGAATAPLTSRPLAKAGSTTPHSWSWQHCARLESPRLNLAPRCGRAGHNLTAWDTGHQPNRLGSSPSGLPARPGASRSLPWEPNAGQPLKIAPLSPPLGRASHETRSVLARGPTGKAPLAPQDGQR